MERLGVIYKATCKISGKSYIGQTINEFSERIRQHCRAKDNYPFHCAIRKYGSEAFEWSILESNIPYSQLNEREIYWIAEYDTYKHGYNATKGGDNAECLDSWRKKHKN